MKCECELVLEFSDPTEARRILDSVKIDNESWISARQEGGRLICTAAAESLGALLHTTEDFLSCVALAERIIKGK